MKRSKVTVIGSINIDLVTVTEKRPKVGETVLGSSFSMVPGGKGANQAVAAARLGADVTLIGRIGDDPFGTTLREHLEAEGVRLCCGQPVSGKSSGVASITLSEGDNTIIVVPGANEEVTPSFVSEFEAEIASSSMILLQLEIPIETIEKTVLLASKYKVPVILNPAPSRPLSKSLLGQISYLTPNEHEANELDDQSDIDFQGKLIVTRGEKGVSFFDNNTIQNIESFEVSVVDTTGAGDSFNGALAVALSEGKTLYEACRFSVAVGALAVTKLGAQSGMPFRTEVEEFLLKRLFKKG
jgi:ribokinase